jgi:hypothetical protein
MHGAAGVRRRRCTQAARYVPGKIPHAAYGFVVNGVNYLGGCDARFRVYP